MSGEHVHIPVLLREVVEILSPRAGEVVLDCTAGLGGHAEAMGRSVGAAGTVHLFDLDAGNLGRAAARVRGTGAGVVEHHGSFADAPRVLGRGAGGQGGRGAEDSRGAGEKGSRGEDKAGEDAGATASSPPAPLPPCSPARHASDGPVNVLLADLGFASPQVDDPARGFSFMRDGPLDMRLDPGSPITAGELVNTMPERELAELIRDLGEEPPDMARRIAAKVVSERKAAPIETTGRLASVVRSAIPTARAFASSIHPATRTFQALRIAVNDELGNLERLLGAVGRAAVAVSQGRAAWLAPGARVGIISFHSLEDRPVKLRFAELVERGLATALTRKPVTATEEEIAANPRARSAKFRAIVVGTRDAELGDGERRT